MWGNGRFGAQGLTRFERQFEPDRIGFLYRRNLEGRGVRASKKERDDLIRSYNISVLRRVIFALIVALLLFVGVLIAEPIIGENEAAASGVVAAILAISYFVCLQMRAWNAPVKKLAGRTLMGIERSRRDARQMRSAQAGWDPIGYAVAVVALFPVAWLDQDGLYGLDWRWLAIFGVAAAGIAIWGRQKVQDIRTYREQNPYGLPPEKEEE